MEQKLLKEPIEMRALSSRETDTNWFGTHLEQRP